MLPLKYVYLLHLKVFIFEWHFYRKFKCSPRNPHSVKNYTAHKWANICHMSYSKYQLGQTYWIVYYASYTWKQIHRFIYHYTHNNRNNLLLLHECIVIYFWNYEKLKSNISFWYIRYLIHLRFLPLTFIFPEKCYWMEPFLRLFML